MVSCVSKITLEVDKFSVLLRESGFALVKLAKYGEILLSVYFYWLFLTWMTHTCQALAHNG